MTTITKERLEWLAHFSCRDDMDHIDGEEIRELARRALASMEAEPVGYFYKTEHGNWYQRSVGDKAPKWIPLYTAPPIPVVQNGWVMVPKIPTPEIKSVIHKIGFRCNCRYCQERHWNELLEAAQEVKSA
ncbi:hypothetical protein [Citrobacter sp. S-77]|uniref:hypothetical protein n=1 Tax=Citrobacter sp. S-77 TaxID=1080067 RepID=UPI0006948275|nr:hypothetical protein [Citrobacter sp. S-77]